MCKAPSTLFRCQNTGKLLPAKCAPIAFAKYKLRILTFPKRSACFCLDDFFFTVLVPCCRAMPDRPGANGAARCWRNGTGWRGKSPLLLWLHLPVRNRDELTPAGFSPSLGGYYSFLPGTCWIQWGCLNSALRPKRARAEPGQSLAHFPTLEQRHVAMGKAQQSSPKKAGLSALPGDAASACALLGELSAGEGQERQYPGATPRPGHAYTHAHVCV